MGRCAMWPGPLYCTVLYCTVLYHVVAPCHVARSPVAVSRPSSENRRPGDWRDDQTSSMCYPVTPTCGQAALYSIEDVSPHHLDSSWSLSRRCAKVPPQAPQCTVNTAHYGWHVAGERTVRPVTTAIWSLKCI